MDVRREMSQRMVRPYIISTEIWRKAQTKGSVPLGLFELSWPKTKQNLNMNSYCYRIKHFISTESTETITHIGFPMAASNPDSKMSSDRTLSLCVCACVCVSECLLWHPSTVPWRAGELAMNRWPPQAWDLAQRRLGLDPASLQITSSYRMAVYCASLA